MKSAEERAEKVKDLKQIENALEYEILRYLDIGDDGLAVAIRRNGSFIRMIVSWGEKWDHVSVSLEDRCPTWEEMCWVKDLFWNRGETVIQYHPAADNYVNVHPYCLHLWKPQRRVIPLPPIEFVG